MMRGWYKKRSCIHLDLVLIHPPNKTHFSWGVLNHTERPRLLFGLNHYERGNFLAFYPGAGI